MKFFKELWQYREMIISLVKRDLKSRYKESVLGFFWMLLNPVLQLCVYTIVFSVIMKMNDIEKYYLFLFVALIPWTFFNTCLTGGAMNVVSQQDMVKKIYFPREVLPVAFVTAQFVNMLLSFIVVFIVILFSGGKIIAEVVFYLPIIMFIEYILTLGITMLISALTVYFRDLEHIVGIISLAWMYLTPVLYPESMVPEKYIKLFYINPMASVIIAYRDILYYGCIPKISTLINASFMGSIFLIAGCFCFDRLQRHFIEEL